MIKKLSKKQQAIQEKQQRKRRFILGGSIIFLALVATSVLIYQASAFLSNHTDKVREARIVEIFDSIKIPEETYFQEDNIFGDKRPYDYDKNRSASSYKRFVVAAPVDETFSNFDQLIRNAGYTYFEEPYPGSTFKQYHYKSDKGEFVRLTVSSKLRDDAGSSDILMKGDLSDEYFKIDPNAGPSRVTIKVNLDDNNE